MFDTPCRFQKLWDNATDDGRKFHYKFRLPDRTRINVEIDWHQQVDLSIVKFYKDQDKNSDKRFNALIGNNYASRTILTVILIVGDYFKRHQNTSLAFMAAERLKDSGANEDESRENTSRYKIYRYALTAVAYQWFIDEDPFTLPSRFKSFAESSLSTLVFVNSRVKNEVGYVKEINELSLQYGELETVNFQSSSAS